MCDAHDDASADDATAPPRAAGEPGGKKIALVGNPNVGKSVIFGALTGRYVVVSNYPGTTVEVSRGTARIDGALVEVIDTPGAAGLIPMSEDEQVARDILLGGEVGRVILVADAKNLERSLCMAMQLAETGLPFVVALNMTDEADSRGITVNVRDLSAALGVEVAPTVATRREGIDTLIAALGRARPSPLAVKYEPAVEAAVARLAPALGARALGARALALMLLAGDSSLDTWARAHLSPDAVELAEKLHENLCRQLPGPLASVTGKARWKSAQAIVARTVAKTGAIEAGLGRKLGDLMMHPVWGWFVLAFALVVTYLFVGRFGAGTLVDLLEKKLFGVYINPFFVALGEKLLPWESLGIVREALVGEYGLVTVALTYAVAIILPIVATFFLLFGVLEDTGYLPRLAVMSNKLFKRMGLNGKAVLPMVLGLGCGTMAVLTSRIMETRKERLLVILLLALGVPCSAQLGVLLGVLGDVGPAGTLLWAGIVAGVVCIVGWIAARIVPGDDRPFVLELPPVRIPQLGNLLRKTFARIRWYLKEAVPLFILGTFVLFVLAKSGLLRHIETVAAPIVQGWLQLPAKATESFIVGFLRRDYGAAGLYSLQQAGELDPIGIVTATVTITLFVPCIANFFIIIKELGLKIALAISAFVFATAFLVGGLVNLVLRGLNVPL